MISAIQYGDAIRFVRNYPAEGRGSFLRTSLPASVGLETAERLVEEIIEALLDSVAVISRSMDPR